MTIPVTHEDPARERTLAEPPEGMTRYAENFMFASYDPASQIGLWLHLGTWPDDFRLWEDLVLLSLPGGEDVLTTTGYRHTPVGERPAGSMLSFTCLEPFTHWRVDFDGLATRSTQSQLSAGLARDGLREQLQIRLDLECVTPVWDGSRSTRGQGSMEEQVWASDHYQQLLQVTGEVVHNGTTYPVHTTGVRDHSRGQRGHAMEQWGGQTLNHLLFTSGRAVGVQRMLAPTGEPMLDMSYTLNDGDCR
ncbi:MAG: hypothetical protein JWP31_810, partial [Aeromicrobium sp.]|nr:hypothetical protein [Aeromicrobium sp.]